MPRKILVIGGSLGGASIAARIRSLDSQAEIVLFEKGASITYAGTAWPGLLADDAASPRDQHNLSAEDFKRQYRIDVRINSEVIAIHRLRRLVDVRPASDLHGKVYKEKYDHLVLATGLVPIRPVVFASDTEGVFTLKSPTDALQIRAWLQKTAASHAVIVGGTATGLEAAAALLRRGLKVTIIEKANHVLPEMDPDMARIVEGFLRQTGVDLKMSRQISQVGREDGRLAIRFDDQSVLKVDLAILTCGGKPDSSLALKAGLKVTAYDTLQVNNGGQTSDKRIWAVGALVGSVDLVSGQPVWQPSASTVTRQARQSADSLCGRLVTAQPTLSLMNITLDGLAAASVGAGESDLITRQMPYSRSYAILPGDDSQPFLIAKILWSRQSRRLLGAQVVGGDSVSDKLASLTMAIQSHLTIDDLSRLPLPNDEQRPGRRNWLVMAGQTALNLADGLVKDFSIYELASLDTSRVLLLDVRDNADYLAGTIPGAVNLPLSDLIAGLTNSQQEMLPGKSIYLFSGTGRQGYLAARHLMQSGRTDVFNLSGGYWLYSRVIGRISQD